MKNISLTMASLLFAVIAQADIVISDGWVKRPVGNVKNTAAFMTLTNTGDRDVNVVAARSPLAMITEIHLMKHAQGVMRMRPVPHVTIPADGKVKLEAGGLHIMMMGLKEELTAGRLVSIELELKDGKRILQNLSVRDTDF